MYELPQKMQPALIGPVWLFSKSLTTAFVRFGSSAYVGLQSAPEKNFFGNVTTPAPRVTEAKMESVLGASSRSAWVTAELNHKNNIIMQYSPWLVMQVLEHFVDAALRGWACSSDSLLPSDRGSLRRSGSHLSHARSKSQSLACC
jgi:hypothetical protein